MLNEVKHPFFRTNKWILQSLRSFRMTFSLFWDNLSDRYYPTFDFCLLTFDLLHSFISFIFSIALFCICFAACSEDSVPPSTAW